MKKMDKMSYCTNGELSDSSTSSIGGGEFEIARVLASLGNNNNGVAAAKAVEEDEEMMESGSVGGGGNSSWGFKGKRSSSTSNKRVKESSPIHTSPLPFDLNVDQPSIFQEDCQNVDVKTEEACESADHGRVSNPPHNGGRSRHNLTEAEKEARRVRRILANRESARQTIRRRQAFHEELTRKAVELASENERLRRSKELAVKEYQTLQMANQDLKGQLSQTLGFKLGGENKGQVESSCTDNPPSADWHQQLTYRNSSANPFAFPTCVQSSELNMSQLSHQYYNPSCMLSEQENALMNINAQKMPVCILPCPVFLSMPNNGTHQLSTLLLHDKDDVSSVDSRHLYSPSSVIRCQHNCPVVLSPDEKMGAQSQNRFGFSLDGGVQSHQQVVPSMSCCSRGEREDCISSHPSPTGMNNIASVLAGNRKERAVRKKECTVAGAEARKKRKELMKLKTRLHCQSLGREYD